MVNDWTALYQETTNLKIGDYKGLLGYNSIKLNFIDAEPGRLEATMFVQVLTNIFQQLSNFHLDDSVSITYMCSSTLSKIYPRCPFVTSFYQSHLPVSDSLAFEAFITRRRSTLAFTFAVSWKSSLDSIASIASASSRCCLYRKIG